MGKIAEFQTDRLLLRDISLDDAPSWTAHFVDYEIIRHLHAHIPWPYPEKGVADFISTKILPLQGKNHWNWVLCELEKPETVIGCISLWRESRPDNRGFWLGRDYWRQGLMTEALKPGMDHAFTDLGFHKVILSNAVGNIRSRRLKEKAGARLLGVEPANFVDPAFTERELWELDKGTWFQSR